MIACRCPHCSKDLQVKDVLVGKEVRCPACQKRLTVPQITASTSPTPPSEGKGLGNLELERTLPHAQPADQERNLPSAYRRDKPGGSSGDQEDSLPAGEGHTEEGGGPKGKAAQAFAGDAADAALTKFLRQPEAEGELGRLGGFRIIKILGQGGMGVVFQGEDPRLHRQVAIKAMLPHLSPNRSWQERFFREARAAAALQHDRIVPILQVGEDRDTPFIVMPFLKGEPLDERLKRHKVLPVADVLRIGQEVAEGLAAAHDKGLVHRDIKPANIWLEDTGERRAAAANYRVKILDFGLARAAGEQGGLTQTGFVVGTPQYMAPEQAAGKKDIDHRCDLFSLGCMLYRMATGQMPFKGEDVLENMSALATQLLREPRIVNREVPRPLSNLIMHLLAKKREDRPDSAHEVAEALAELAARDAGQMPSRTGKTSLLRRPASLATRPRRAVLAAALVLVVTAGGLALFLRTGNTDPEQGPEKKGTEETTMGQGPLPSHFTNSLGMQFGLVPKGKSWLGGDGGRPPDREVEILHDFYLGVYEVTQEDWKKVTGFNPSAHHAVPGVAQEELKRFPVDSVSWDDCKMFISLLNDKAKETGWVYRLPTDVEWEYACRGGPMQDRFDGCFSYYFEKPQNRMEPDQANFGHPKGLKRPCKVGSYKPNRLGLCDMHGNVEEWCQDEMKDDKGGTQRVARGGSWFDIVGASGRKLQAPSFRSDRLGLRLARVPSDKKIVRIAAEEKPVVEAKSPPAFTNSLGMQFALVPRGKSWLGGSAGKPGHKEVEIRHDFYLGVYEVTQEEWEKVTGVNPSQFKTTPEVKRDTRRFPVEQVSWDEVQDFIKRVNGQVKEPAWVYRLPTEVEWEYACRGGPMADKSMSAFDYYLQKPANELLATQANFVPRPGLQKGTCAVGSYPPNRLGLYDMHGNVWEWCQDAEEGPDGSTRRAFRGGAWYNGPGFLRAAVRDSRSPSHHDTGMGLRLARVPAGKDNK
jgi:formylglycine-generating enzyme required for sulfatase activity